MAKNIPVAPFNAPRDWCRKAVGDTDLEHLVLWHGCTGNDATNIVKHGVDSATGRENTDFGRGFYLTTIERQARSWAWERYYFLPKPQQGGGNTPMTLRFRLPRQKLAELQSLYFILPDYHNEDYWSLVHHCRSSTKSKINNHRCTTSADPNRSNWYDLVVGPAAAMWRQRVCMTDADQFSFHTSEAVDILNACIDDYKKRGIRSKQFRIVPV